MDTLKLGQIIDASREAQRDATHIAVAPVVARHQMRPGDHVGVENGEAYDCESTCGIVDPFLPGRVKPGQMFWLFLYPGSITGLRHEWTHPAFSSEAKAQAPAEAVKSASEQWMRAWALIHMSEDYYGDGDKLGPEAAYQNALRAGEDMHVGPYESAADLINEEWWSHWEAITGKKGQRGEYFSCSC